jgi:dCTP deaminase
LGVVVHLTAGYIDPGFDGQVTLEVTCIHPVRVYAGMRIAQVRFESLQGQVSLYDGHYKGPTAIGAIASHSWEQFE